MRSVDDHLTIEQMDLPLGVLDVAGVMGDHADRRSIGVQPSEQFHDRPAVLRVEVAGRLVGEQDRGLSTHGSSAGNPLLLATRELARCFARCAISTFSSASVTRSFRSAGRMPR